MIVFVAGTATEVGKTWYAAAVARALLDTGRAVDARKPAQSFAPGDGPTDAEVLAGVTGEAPERVCPRHRWYEVPMAPPMAADALGRPPFSCADLAGEVAPPASPGSTMLVEGAGGPRSPIAHDGDNVALARALHPDLVLLVADAGLGTINAVRLSAAALGEFPTVVALNRFDPDDDLHRRNRVQLVADGFTLVTDPDAALAHLRG